MLYLTQPTKFYNYICIVINDILKLKVNIKNIFKQQQNIGFTIIEFLIELKNMGRGVDCRLYQQPFHQGKRGGIYLIIKQKLKYRGTHLRSFCIYLHALQGKIHRKPGRLPKGRPFFSELFQAQPSPSGD